MVSYLFPAPSHGIHVSVDEGVVTLEGHVRDTSPIPLAVRLVRGVEGVVDVEARLTGEGARGEGAALTLTAWRPGAATVPVVPAVPRSAPARSAAFTDAGTRRTTTRRTTTHGRS
ncbi:hypothetical protein GCM10009535_24720 [Streptomyces thermocarboxydovorans]|uniref:BON domain-containing protein n=1 Tax=Streptomyces thermocarboxydovorans TaxID=59298 RepID=A0ABN1HG36_9ACTN